MDQNYNKEYFEAQKEMEKFRKSVDPLVALLLIDDHPQDLLESVVRKLPIDVIERIDIRFHLIYQLLQNQRRRLELGDSSSDQVSDYSKYCDFNEVMKILGRSKGKVESLIKEKKLIVFQDNPGEKRRFLRSQIFRYAEQPS